MVTHDYLLGAIDTSIAVWEAANGKLNTDLELLLRMNCNAPAQEWKVEFSYINLKADKDYEKDPTKQKLPERIVEQFIFKKTNKVWFVIQSVETILDTAAASIPQ